MRPANNPLLSLALLVIALGFIVCSFFFFSNLKDIQGLFAHGGFENGSIPLQERPHLLLIYPEEDSLFTQDLIRGVLERAQEFDAVLETRPFQREAAVQTAAYYLRVGILSAVDAILLYDPNPGEETILQIEAAWEQGVPLITLVNDIPESRRSAFVGQDAYQLGVLSGTMVRQAGIDGDLAVVLDQSSELPISQYNRLLLEGLRANLLGSANISHIFYSDRGPFAGRRIGEAALAAEPRISTLLITSTRDTPGIVQDLVENARVGEITLIGFDLTGTLEDYLVKGLVHASINRLPWHIGFRGLGSAMALIRGEDFERDNDPGTLIHLSQDLRTRTVAGEP